MKLSTAIRKGLEKGKKYGIKHSGEDGLYMKDSKGKLTCMCTLGFAYLGKFGIRKATENLSIMGGGRRVLEAIGAKNYVEGKCLMKALPEKIKRESSLMYGLEEDRDQDVYNLVVELNDEMKQKPLTIAKELEKCGH